MLNLLISTKRVVNLKLLCASLSANTLLITVFCTAVVNFHFFKNIMAVILNRKMHESDEKNSESWIEKQARLASNDAS